MATARGVAQLGTLAVGLGIGLAVAATPGVGWRRRLLAALLSLF
jgi:hypothetical protein